jgi:hypothetical protein
MSDNKTLQTAAMWVTDKGAFYLKANRNIKEGEGIYFLKNRNKTKTNNQPDWIAFEYKDKIDKDRKKEL